LRLVALPSRKQQPEPRGLDYTRFIILSGPRTGSNLLAQALDSNPAILCFRELFNVMHDFVQFDVEGYDNFAKDEIEGRRVDPVSFLDSRVFCPQPVETHAVGFKFQYGQFWGFPGILERLSDDSGIRVVHLQRRNPLRALVSLKLAQRTGSFVLETKRQPPHKRLAFAARHPLRATRRLQKKKLPATRPAIEVSPEELATFIVKTNQTAQHHERLFRGHPMLRVYYEELAQSVAVVDQVSRFLGVRPAPPVITLRRQNPEPLAELIQNYDELRDAFKSTPHESLFDA
jgi:LPS sulfotransferase NodH